MAEKDIRGLLILLKDHKVGESKERFINTKYIVKLFKIEDFITLP